MRTRAKKNTGAAAVELQQALLAERFSKMQGPVPGVLTPEAVVAGYMPPPGQSGLPASLEKGVPPEYRYWLVEDAGQAAKVRNALVEKGLLTPETVLDVHGVGPTRVVRKTFVAVEEDPPAGAVVKYQEPLPAAQYAALQLVSTQKAIHVYEQDEAPALEELLKQVGDEPWLVAFAETQEVLASLWKAAQVKSVFKVATRPGLVFASSVELGKSHLVQPLAPPVIEDVITFKRLYKAKGGKKTEKAELVEERYILGVVLEPETKDLQDDIYSAEEIRKTAHDYMERHHQLGLQHEEIVGGVGEGKLILLETYIAPVDFTPEGSTEQVKKGSWLMGVRVVDDELWEAVKKGEFTGYSIGGNAIRTKEK